MDMPESQLNARQIDLFNTDHVKRIVAEIDNEQNRRRKRRAWDAFQCKEDNQKEYVVKELKRKYPKTYKQFEVGNVKICKKIVEKLSKAYKNDPNRTGVTETETDFINEVYDKYNFHRSFKEFDELVNLHKYAFMMLTWQNASEPEDRHTIPVEEGQYVLHALAPYEFDLIRDQVTGEPLIFILSYPDSDITRLAGKSDGIEQTISESQSDTSAQTIIYKMWSPTKKIEAEVKRAKGHGNDDNEKLMTVNFIKKAPNLLGRLPGGYFQKDLSVDYPVGSDLGETSIDWNVRYSSLLTGGTTQAHGQLVISSPEGQKQKDVHMGMHTAIHLPQSKKPDAPQTTAEYISANPDLSGHLEILKFDIVNILDDYKIKAKNMIQGAANSLASGFARLVDEADVQDVVEDNQSIYVSTVEQEVFKTLKAYEKAMNQTKIRNTDELEVNFEKPKVMISDKETLENIEKREQLGTLLPYEKHMILNPNLTKEQAVAREEEIQAEMLKKIELQEKMFPNDDEETEEE